MKAVFGTLFSAFFMVGCVAPSVESGTRELREFDLRNSNYQYVDSSIYMDLPTVQRQLYIHREACDVELLFRKDPRQVHFASVFYGPAGVTNLRDQVMLDLTAYATGKLGIKGYSYYAENKGLTQSLVEVLENPTVCPGGISPNPNPSPYVNMTPQK